VVNRPPGFWEFRRGYVRALLRRPLGQWLRDRRAPDMLAPARWPARNDGRPRAILQISHALQPNGLPVNYGDLLVLEACRGELTRRGYVVLALPREAGHEERIRAQRPALFIDCAGFVYSASHKRSMRGAEAAGITTANAAAARAVGAVTATAPQAYGPFDGQEAAGLRDRVRTMAAGMDVVYARDALSAEMIQEVTGVAARQAPDSAFLYEPPPVEEGRRVLEGCGVKAGRSDMPVVGITPNRQLRDRWSGYMEAMERVARDLMAAGAQVVTIPHEQGRFGRREAHDQMLARWLAERTGALTLAKEGRLPRYAELEHIHGIEAALGALDLFVSGRFHSALRALAVGVPTLVFSWSHKYEALLRTVELPPAAHVLRLDEFGPTAGGAGAQRLVEALRCRDQTRRHLLEIMPGVQARCGEFFDRVTELVGRRRG
jgi:polysaccharide pyruvyl transferase WcaK-like protein